MLARFGTCKLIFGFLKMLLGLEYHITAIVRIQMNTLWPCIMISTAESYYASY